MVTATKTARLAVVGGIVLCLALAGCSTSEGTSDAAVASIAPSVDPVLAEATSQLPAEIVSSGELVIATDGVSRPNSYIGDGGDLVGWEIELGNEIAARLGLTARFVVTPFDQIITEVAGGAVDMGLASMFDTKLRQQEVVFVDYYQGGVTWAAPAGSAITPDTACGLTIAVRSGTYQQTVDLPAKSAACEKSGQEPIIVTSLRTQDEVTNEVLSGFAAAYTADSPVTLDAILQSSGRLVQAGRTYDVQFYGMPLRKNREGLAPALLAAITDLQADGTYSRVLGKWGVDEGAILSPYINAGSS
jgi:polar amino acid transport system substrate-binding protein